MQVFFWLVFLVVVGLAIFAIQNSTAPPVEIKLFFWPPIKTSFVLTILGSIGSGVLLMLLLWIPMAIRATLRTRKLRKEIEYLKGEMKPHVEENKPKEP